MIVSNGGSGSLGWSASKTAAWLSLSSASGTSGLSVTVSENLTGLNPGTYTDNITITAEGAINSPLVVPVTLTVTAGGGSTFVYDGDGRRVKKTENGQTIVYVNKYFESNLTASENTTYYYLGGRLTAMRNGESLRYVHQDHLTGTSLMTDTSGNQVGTTMKYYPFGGTRSGSVPTDIKFTGQRLDESGLYYFNARYYDPQIGRFISADTIVPGAFNSQAFNRYGYVANNPLKYNDPTGHELGVEPVCPPEPPPEPPPPPDPEFEIPGWSFPLKTYHPEHHYFGPWVDMHKALNNMPKGLDHAEILPTNELNETFPFVPFYAVTENSELQVRTFVLTGRMGPAAVTLGPGHPQELPNGIYAPVSQIPAAGIGQGLIKHELTHWSEQNQWGFVWFVAYIVEYCLLFSYYGNSNSAHDSMSFELRAYRAEGYTPNKPIPGLEYFVPFAPLH